MSKQISYFSFVGTLGLLLLVAPFHAFAQVDSLPYEMLLTSNRVKIETTQAMDDLYNFKFEEAEKQFRWMKQFYPDHPMPYFLFALSYRWRILPNMEHDDYDKKCLAYLDTAIQKAEGLYKQHEDNIEASFFLAASWGFIGWLHSERRNWGKATVAAKQAVDYMKKNIGHEEFSPEFLFGEGLYNYYVEWVPENFPMLRMVTAFFPDGDKDKGINQLHTVVTNAFYARVESYYFLIRIYDDVGETRKALELCRNIIKEYPNNAYFHRMYCRLLYKMGYWDQMQVEARRLLQNVEEGKTGYEENSGRYAGFFLGTLKQERYNEPDSAIYYYNKAITYARKIGATTLGYYLYSLMRIGDIYQERGDLKKAEEYYSEVIGDGERKHSAVKQAKRKRRDVRKKIRKKKKEG